MISLFDQVLQAELVYALDVVAEYFRHHFGRLLFEAIEEQDLLEVRNLFFGGAQHQVLDDARAEVG